MQNINNKNIDENNYISLKDIQVTPTYTDDNYDNNKYIYQIQRSSDNECGGYIMEVGISNSIVDVIINKFDINTKIKCIIVSTIFNKDTLTTVSESCVFNMIKIIINYNDGQKLTP